MSLELGVLLGQYGGFQSFTDTGSWDNEPALILRNFSYSHSSDIGIRIAGNVSSEQTYNYNYHTANDIQERWSTDVTTHRLVTYFYGYVGSSNTTSGYINYSINSLAPGQVEGYAVEHSRHRFETIVSSGLATISLNFGFVSENGIPLFFLDDVLTSVDVIDLKTTWDFENNTQQNITYDESIGGKLSKYNWSDHQTWNVPLEFVCGSEANLLNNWWRNGYNLMFTDNSSDTTRNYVVRIVNDSEPITSVNVPYNDQFSGTLKLEAISNKLQF